MRRIALLGLFVGFVAPVLVAAPAHAQATRTWVSGVGDDVNPCSRTAPCKTFAGAVSKTAAGGEINCLDPGGYGTITITKAMTLSCGYTFGSILASGVPGITINATGAADRVVLRGLTLQGINQSPGVAGTIGVRILAAAVVTIEDTEITAFAQQGISDNRTAANVKLFVRNSVISHNTGNGISLTATAASHSDFDNVSSINNLVGITTNAANTAIFRRGVLSGNGTGVLVPGGEVNINDASVSSNTTGVSASGVGVVRLSNSEIAGNGTGFVGVSGSFGNNRIYSNATPGPLPITGAASTDHGQQ